MIFAAGLGTRLRPLTSHCPKCLLTVADKPLIVHHLQHLAMAGVKELVINIAWLGQQIVDRLGNGDEWGLRIRYSREPDPANPLETGGGLRHALTLLDSEVILAVNADIWTDYPFANLIDYPLPADFLAHLVLVNNPPGHKGDFILRSENRSRLQLPKEGAGALTFSGISLLRPALVADWPELRFSLREPLQKAIADSRVSGEHYDGMWHDAGSLSSLRALRERWGN